MRFLPSGDPQQKIARSFWIGSQRGSARLKCKEFCVGFGKAKKWEVLVRPENVDHLRQNLGVLSLANALAFVDPALIDTISFAGEEEKLCCDPR